MTSYPTSIEFNVTNAGTEVDSFKIFPKPTTWPARPAPQRTDVRYSSSSTLNPKFYLSTHGTWESLLG